MNGLVLKGKQLLQPTRTLIPFHVLDRSVFEHSSRFCIHCANVYVHTCEHIGIHKAQSQLCTLYTPHPTLPSGPCQASRFAAQGSSSDTASALLPGPSWNPLSWPGTLARTHVWPGLICSYPAAPDRSANQTHSHEFWRRLATRHPFCRHGQQQRRHGHGAHDYSPNFRSLQLTDVTARAESLEAQSVVSHGESFPSAKPRIHFFNSPKNLCVLYHPVLRRFLHNWARVDSVFATKH